MLSPKEQLIAEAKLANELLDAAASARPALYGQMYDEMYRMHFARNPDILEFGATESFVPFLLGRTQPGQVVVEVGCGTGFLSIELARAGRTVIGYDVSAVALDTAVRRARAVAGVRFELLSGFELPRNTGSVDFAYSVEVLEHLHEEDVPAHLHAVARVLKPGGSYWIHTPYRDPTFTAAKRFGLVDDISLDGDVHLKEWTYSELAPVLRRCGFATIRLVWWFWGKRIGRVPLVPIWPMLALERLPIRLPPRRWKSLTATVDCSILARVPPVTRGPWRHLRH